MAEKIPTTVRVYNRSTTRSFIHDKLVLSPSSFVNAPEDVAKIWLDGWPNEIVEAGVAQKELGGVQAELAAAKARIAELETAASSTKPKNKSASEVV